MRFTAVVMNDITGVLIMRKNILLSLLAATLCIAASARPAQRTSLLITGQVLNAEGSPVSNVNVYAYPLAPLEGRLPAASSDKEGKFSIPVEHAGKFVVVTSKVADGYPSTYSIFYNLSGNSLPEVLVEENQAPPVVTIRLGPKAGKLLGRIVDAETSQPIKEVQISLCRAEAPMYCHRTSAGGPSEQFQFLVPAVPLTVQVSAPGYKDWYSNAETQEPLQVEADTTKELSISLHSSSADSDENQSSLEAPAQLSPVDGTEFDHFPRTTKLEWSPVAGAASYSVEIDFCDGAERGVKECRGPQPLQHRFNPPSSGIKTTDYEFTFIGAQPGRWRVWAVDAEGHAGAKSAWSTFFYKR
jgi:hypothetical protein